jgi:serine/threonine protein phosphatase PrpC
MKKHTILDTSALTDTGIIRENNEDSLFVLDSGAMTKKSGGIYMVADGMGGHQAGEVASDMAVNIISKQLSNILKNGEGRMSPDLLIGQAVEKANEEIYEKARDKPELFSMGTTVTLGLRLENRLYIGHVGDSRAYLVRKGRIRQLTEDHSLVAQLYKEGIITAEEVKIHPERNKIYRCLGISTKVEVDSYRKVGGKDWLPLHNGDILLFCTDGLSGYVSDTDCLDSLLHADNAESACRKLVNLANLESGEDNISVIVVRIVKVPVTVPVSEVKLDGKAAGGEAVGSSSLKSASRSDRIGSAKRRKAKIK